MKRSGFKRPERARAPRPPLVLGAEPSRAVMRVVDRDASPARVPQKTPDRKVQAIRDSARGEECLVRLPGVCAHDPAHTIWSHAKWSAAGKGGAIKSLDLAGAYCCTACDAVYDGQRKAIGLRDHEVDLAWCMGHFRSLIRLAEKGLL